MAGTLSAADRQKLAQLEELGGKVQHVHGLVERFAVATDDADALQQSMRRAFSRLKLELMGAGMDAMAQLCGAMDTAARRGGSRNTKARILREGVGSLRQQVELAQRAVRSDAERQARTDGERGGGATPPPP